MRDLVSGFIRHHGTLSCDGLALSEVAAATGTPVHVYSAALLEQRYRAFDAPFAAVPHRLHYALKANPTLEIARRMRTLGAGADANSLGELEVALRAGFAPPDVVFTGVGKTPAELQRAVALGLRAINVESFGEVARIEATAEAVGSVAAVALRVNPDVDAGSHPHISTGSSTTKFGVSTADAYRMAREMSNRPRLRLVGLHVHVGSQITTAEPFVRAAATVSDMARELAADSIALEHLDLGGGLGVPYQPDQPCLSPEAYAKAILPAVGPAGLTLLLEPGRWIVGPSGVLLTTVVDLKPKPEGGTFVIVDAGMTELIRPALYGSWHRIEPVVSRSGPLVRADVVGPVCETSDAFGTGRDLPPVEVGDVLVIRDTGAYGAVMASNYNRRPIAAEAIVDSGTCRIVRRRQSIDDMLQWDV
jgi:diaminopimelate decarboxylase